MADDLKGLFEGMEADADEMRRYRARLGQTLAEQETHRRLIFPWPILAAALVLVLAGLWWTGRAEDPLRHPMALSQLQTMAQTSSDPAKLLQRANALLGEDEAPARRNAEVLICLLTEGETAVLTASRALADEDRPEFKAFYLELLLDNGDDWIFNLSRLETMIEDESDPICLYYLRHLLDLAV